MNEAQEALLEAAARKPAAETETAKAFREAAAARLAEAEAAADWAEEAAIAVRVAGNALYRSGSPSDNLDAS